MNDQLTGATNKLGIFGKTLSQINNDLSKGKIASLFHLVPKSEIQSLQNYGQTLLVNSNKIKNLDKLLAKGKITQQTYNQTIENAVGSTKNLSSSSQLLALKIKQLHKDYLTGKIDASEYTEQVKAMTTAQNVASASAKFLGTVLKTVFNVGISIAISAIITWIQELATENQRMAEMSKQAADEIKGELDGLEEYSKKIVELRRELEDNNTTTERATEVRKELLDIQNDLIESYGAEKDSINLITGNIEKQIEAIRKLGKAKYDSQYYSTYQATDTTLTNMSNLSLLLDDRAWKDERNQMWHTGNSDTAYRNDVKEYMESILEAAGFKWKGGYYVLDGNAFDVHDALTSVEKQVNEAIDNLDINNYPNVAAMQNAEKQLKHILTYLSAVNNDVTKPLISHEEELSQYIKYEGKYSEQYWKLVTDRTNYEVAKGKGSYEEILVAKKKFIEDYQNLEIDEGDSAVQWWFEKEFKNTTEEEVKTKAAEITYPVRDALYELNEQVEGLYDSFDTAFSNQSTIQSAFDKIQSGTSLTASEMKGLIKLCKGSFPEIGTLFTKTAKGYTISAENLIKANNAIMNSTKQSVQSQIDGYQDVINKYEEYEKKLSYIQDMSDMPDSVKETQLGTLGITKEEYEQAKSELQNLLPLLDLLNISLSSTSESANAFSKAIEDSTKQITFIKSAMEEMSDNGYVSASTYQTLVEKGKKYVECLDLVNGKLVLNINKLKDLESQQLRSLIIDNNIRINKLNESLAHGANADAIRDETNAIRGQNTALEQQIEDIWSAEPTKSGSSKNDDPIKEAFEKEMKDIEHLHNMGLASDKEYYDALEKANEEHYKNSAEHESDYLSNVEKIYKGRQSLYKDDADKQFDDLEEQFKNGEITAEQYAKVLYDLGQSLYGKDSPYANTEFVTKALEELDKQVKEVSDDIYSELKDSLSADGDRLLDDVLADADELSKKNIELFKNKGDLKTFKKNAEDIFKTVSASAKDALERGLITPERFKEIIDAYSEGLDSGIIQDIFDDGFDAIADKAKDNLDKMLITPDEYFKLLDEWGKKLNISEDVIKKLKEALSESDYLDAWDLENGFDSKKSADNFKLRAERIKYIFELAEQLYGKDGQDNVKAYNELIKQGLEDEQSLVEDYYDKEIEKLEKINDEEEKRQKAIELQMNLIKARQKLEDAKKQKNQLVFHNGTFEYMADQEAVKSAQEDVLEAEKAILEQQVEDQKEALEERKKAVFEFFNKVEGDVSGALERIERFLSGDTSVYEKPVDKADSISNESNNIIDTIGNLGTKGTFEKIVSLFGGTPANNSMRDFMDSFASTLIGKQIIPTTIRDAITNNSNTTNNTAKTEIHIDKIFENLNMPQGTTKEQVEEFFKHLNQAILQRIPQVILDVKK